MNDSLPLLTIRCITYNHESYIEQCLEGFVMQQTNFRFEAVVHDDASTDGTADIIREYAAKYPDIIKPIYQTENQYSKQDGSLRKIMNEHTRGKYAAFCEGDDYWTDPLKLQKQVDFMETHPEYGLVYTDIDLYYQNCGKYQKSAFKNGYVHRPLNFEEHLITRGYIAPCTWLVKKDLFCKDRVTFTDGTFAVALDIFATSKIGFIDDVTATYRVLEESASHSWSPEKRYIQNVGVFKTQLHYAALHRMSEVNINSFKVLAYHNLFPFALLLKDDKMIDEVIEFSKNHKSTTKVQLLLMFKNSPLFNVILRLLFKYKGYN